MTPEADLVPGLDTEFVAQILGNDYLPLGPDPMSHTSKYNSAARSEEVATWLGG